MSAEKEIQILIRINSKPTEVMWVNRRDRIKFILKWNFNMSMSRIERAYVTCNGRSID